MRLVGVVIAVVLLSGCTAAAPQGYADGIDRESCGNFTLGQGEMAPDDAVACIRAAVGTTAAELVVTSLTDEGDPITTSYRTAADDDGYTVYIDGTQDSFGTGEWTVLHCPGDGDPLTLTGCTG